MNKQQTLNLLGIARSAGELISGEEMVLKAIRTQKTSFVFIASDAGSAASKKFQDKTNFYHVKFNQSFSKDELNQATGLNRTVYGVTSQGFSKKFKELLNM